MNIDKKRISIYFVFDYVALLSAIGTLLRLMIFISNYFYLQYYYLQNPILRKKKFLIINIIIKKNNNPNP